MKMGEIHSIKTAVEIATTLRFYWFRGHSRVYEDLTPKVFRNEQFRRYETQLSANFMMRAQAVQENCPSFGIGDTPPGEYTVPSVDHVAWLFLMQHHGAPTRLLDWSGNLLVALYFAVRNRAHDKDDGELWILNPIALNAAQFDEGAYILTQEDVDVRRMACQAISPSPDLKVRRSPIAIMPPAVFPRITQQTSRFTIHPPPAEGNSIGDVISDPSLGRYLIPRGMKARLRADLRAIGVHEFSLFADLDSLAVFVEEYAITSMDADHVSILPPGD